MKKKLMALLLAVAVVGMYSFGSIGSVFAEDTTTPSIELDNSSATLYVGNTTKLTATVKNADGATVVWKSSDEKVATVSDGTVTGVAEGTATVTAIAQKDGAEVASATASVTVTKAPVVDEGVKNVESLIDAIPKTTYDYTSKTEDEKAAVANARKAYDALTTDQKGKVSNYNELENAEKYIAGYSNKHVTKWDISGKAPWEETTKGIDIKIDQEVVIDGKTVDLITYTIPSGFDGDKIWFNPIEDALEAFEGTYMPGASRAFVIKIVNNASQKYEYAENSFTVTVEDVAKYYTDSLPIYSYDSNLNESKGFISGAQSFANTSIYGSYGTNRTCNTAIQALLGITSTLSNISNNRVKMTDEYLGNLLIEKGYTNGIADLNAYYLDFYNNKYTLSAESLGELPTKVQSEILRGNRFYNRETNTEVAELGEDFFYNLCFKLTPTVAGNTDGNTNYTVGSYMRGSDVMEKYCKEAFSTIETGKDYSLTSLELSLDGPLTTNAFMGMEFGMYPIFSINKVETKVDPPTPVVQTTSYNVVANYYTSTDGGEYVKDNASEVTLKDATTVNVGDTITATPEDSWMAYNGNKYGLDESKSTLTKVAVLDRATNTLTLNYYRSVKNGSDDPDNNNKHDWYSVKISDSFFEISLSLL